MKKFLICIIFMHTLTLNSYAAKLKDCSVISKFNPKYLTCKATNIVKDTVNYQSKEWSKNDKSKKKD